jgi:hypothetical protein
MPWSKRKDFLQFLAASVHTVLILLKLPKTKTFWKILLPTYTVMAFALLHDDHLIIESVDSQSESWNTSEFTFQTTQRLRHHHR